jgi:hypothetical protein
MGGATLATQLVKCSCGKSRNLARVVEASTDGATTYLSANVNSDPSTPHLCGGVSPQHGSTDTGNCNRPLRGSLRAASNLYFAVVRSALYLPRSDSTIPPELVKLVRDPTVFTFAKLLRDSNADDLVTKIRDFKRSELEGYTDDELGRAVDYVLDEDEPDGGPPDDEDSTALDDAEFRMEEAEVLRKTVSSEELLVRSVDRDKYAGVTRQVFSRIQLVEKLRETRVLAGFNRVFPEQEMTRRDRLGQLWSTVPASEKSWLPANVVYGEGIYLELDEELLSEWEVRDEVVARAARLQSLYSNVQSQRRLRQRELSPRFVLVHSFAHVLMNRLTFECGYSSAALRERLYVSTDDDSKLGALLIYTAAGDAEGTMGGLVRMGEPDYLESVVEGAVAEASWCASDPVCMEIGSTVGQGPDSCNLAACHSCSLVPETACEEFNRFLDRGFLVGSVEDPDLPIGFFGHDS